MRQLLQELDFDKVVVEKPVFESILEVNSMDKSLLRNSSVRVAYPRRCLPSTAVLKDLLSLNRVDARWRGELSFEGSLTNIASHFLDLLEYLFSCQFEFFPTEAIGFMYCAVSEQPNLEIKINRISDRNTENSSMLLKGNLQVDYSNSGRKIVCDINGIKFNLSTQLEIDNMLMYEAMDYLNWTFNGTKSKLPMISEVVSIRVLSAGLQ